LADDSVTIQRVIELTFADEDVQVTAVGDGKQAIDRVKADRPDIVLADVGMPERDGYEVAAFIKADPQLAHIPVLLLTGAFEPIDEVRARAVGCDGVLVKPFEPQMVISRVRDLLAGNRPAAAPATPAAHAVRPPAAAAPVQHSEPQPSAPIEAIGGSLEDYFDRLDAALATKTSPAAAPQATPQTAGPAHPVAPAHPPAPPRVAPSTSAPVPKPAASPAVTHGSPPPAAPSRPPAPVAAPPPAAEDPHGDLDLGGWDPSAPDEPVPASPPAPPVVPAPAAAAPITAPAWHPPALQDAFAALLSAEQGQPIAPAVSGASRVESLSTEAVDEIVQRVIARMGDESMRTAVLDAAERLVREEIARIKGQN
jgi:CheY-like chemotaxis protein